MCLFRLTLLVIGLVVPCVMAFPCAIGRTKRMKVLSYPNKSAYVDIYSKLKDDCFDKLPVVLFFS